LDLRKETIKNGARSAQRCWGVIEPGVLSGLLLYGSLASFGALDTLLFGGATAPDVGLHRRYNRSGAVHLQYRAPLGSIRGPIAIRSCMRSN
jgi:hypothetical protein